MERQQRIELKLDYINNLYRIALKGISADLLELCEIKSNLEFADDLKSLLKVDNTNYVQIQRLRKIFKNYADPDECRELYHRLFMVHKAIFTLLKEEYNIHSCWENEVGRLEYLKV